MVPGRFLIAAVVAPSLMGALFLLAPPAHGQSIYKWIDADGVVHFGDAPPSGTRGASPVELPAEGRDRPPVKQHRKRAAEKKKSSSHGKKAARVRIREKSVMQIGPAAREISGKVKNSGGRPAEDVIVVVSVIDVDQNGPCMQEEIAVTPSTLGPGESGAFSSEIEHPCLYGNTEIKFRAEWR